MNNLFKIVSDTETFVRVAISATDKQDYIINTSGDVYRSTLTDEQVDALETTQPDPFIVAYVQSAYAKEYAIVTDKSELGALAGFLDAHNSLQL